MVCTVEDLPRSTTLSTATDRSVPNTNADDMCAAKPVCSTADGQTVTPPRATTDMIVESVVDTLPHVTDTVPTLKIGPSLSRKQRETAWAASVAGGGCCVTDPKVGGVANVSRFSIGDK